MASKVLILAGAPENKALDWNSAELLTGFQHRIVQFVGLDQTEAGASWPRANALLESTAPTNVAWRSIQLERAHMPTGFSQQRALRFAFGPGQSTAPEFMSTAAAVSFSTSFGDGSHDGSKDRQDQDTGRSLVSQFYEHSLAVHEEMPSSFLPAADESENTSYLSDNASSLLSADDSSASPIREPLQFRGASQLSDLDSIPSAAYLDKIHPQTMTCNLIVGIVSISQPKALRTRWGSTRYLVEVLVADETKAGFAITFWLSSDSVAESVLAGLRPQDVVLMQNVALNSFTKKVYGTTLRKDLTKVHLLYRARLDARDNGGYYSASDLRSNRSAHAQLDKTRRVWDWVLKFVGHKREEGSRPGVAAPRHPWNRPPLDDSYSLAS
ncbi:hypothetical protein B0T22DRAFT_26936 [Podospora appendiculata]|uniref:Telomeric single stranded DNA binding POT1/Cdc13 domain-containing protein n=1 Tax=Podospora appendiculata TaxID=314037 RepID=A0AAE0XG47_9PEZI|nr:hypothetical protein B0T22DRAFT_26936 [Podospora appendiculata]